MSDLPKKHAKPCPKCGGILWLKDYDPTNLWYGCENYKSQGCKGSISANEVMGVGAQKTGNETFRTSKIECPECHCHIIVDVHASSLGVVKPKDTSPKTTAPRNVQKQQEIEEEEVVDDDIPF